jgi:hypothetical protein
MQLARRGSQWFLGHVNRRNDFDAHGDRSARRTDQARMTCQYYNQTKPLPIVVPLSYVLRYRQESRL